MDFTKFYQVGNEVLSYFTINLGYEIRHDLVSNLIKSEIFNFLEILNQRHTWPSKLLEVRTKQPAQMLLRLIIFEY